MDKISLEYKDTEEFKILYGRINLYESDSNSLNITEVPKLFFLSNSHEYIEINLKFNFTYNDILN